MARDPPTGRQADKERTRPKERRRSAAVSRGTPVDDHRQLRPIQSANYPWFIPIVNHAMIRQHGWGTPRAGIPWIHVEPDRVDTDVCTRAFCEELLLRPPGGIKASGSCRREEKDDSHLAPIAIEVRPECRDPR